MCVCVRARMLVRVHVCVVCVCLCACVPVGCSIDRSWLEIQTNLIIIFISRLNPSAVCTWPRLLLTASHSPLPSLLPLSSLYLFISYLYPSTPHLSSICPSSILLSLLSPASIFPLSFCPPSILSLSFYPSSTLPLLP